MAISEQKCLALQSSVIYLKSSPARYLGGDVYLWRRLSLKVLPKVTLIGIFAAGCTLFATPIPVSNTGTIGGVCQGTVVLSSGCTLMTHGQVGDPHYTLDSGPTQAVTSVGRFPVPPWLPDNSTSTWIQPFSASPRSKPAGDYVYTQTFTAATAGSGSILAGRWASDNAGEMYFNGVLVSTSPYGSNQAGHSYNVWHAFTITSGFVQGLNTLEFRVNNLRPGVTGLRVEFSQASLPEPAEIITTMALLAGVFWLASRRRSGVAALA